MLTAAFLIVEDDRFFRRSGGVDLRALLRAARADVLAMRFAQGGSTIPMQLSRSILHVRYEGLLRKVAEVRLATDLRRRYTADELMDLYLNNIYLGPGLHGVGAAAREYFGREPEDLPLDEAALIAALPANPGRRNPRLHPDVARYQRNRVLDRMAAAGLISQDHAAELKARPISTRASRGPRARRSLLALLRSQCQRCYPESAPRIVATTIDRRLQALLEQAFLQTRAQGRSLAAVALAPDGGVLAAVGDIERVAPLASVLKPISVAVALEHAVVDLRQRASMLHSESFDSGTERWLRRICRRERGGDPTLAQALALSRNCEAAKVFAALGDSLRPEIARFGIPVPHGNLANALGLVEANLLQLSAAYAAFMNGGAVPSVHALDACSDSATQVMRPETAAAVLSALHGTVRFGTAAAAAEVWPDRRVALAAKTGTADRVHTAVLLTRDVVLVLRLEASSRLAATAGRTVAPIGIRVLRQWYGDQRVGQLAMAGG